MVDSVLSDLSTALDLVVLEPLPAGGFRKAADTHVPPWFLSAFAQASGEDPLSLLDAFPVLDAFLRDAEALWSGDADGRTDGEPFIIVDQSGRDVPVTATALLVRGHRYLLLQTTPSFKDRQRELQTARDHALAHERIVRQMQALRTPVATLARIVDDPKFTSHDAHAAATAIRDQVDLLRGLLDQLPQPARGATPGRR